MKFLILFALFVFTFSSACQGQNTLSINSLSEVACPDQQVCVVSCNDAYYSTCAEKGELKQTIQIDPSYGISAAYEAACVTNSQAMVTFKQASHSIIEIFISRVAEALLELLSEDLSLLTFGLIKPKFTQAQNKEINQYYNEFMSFVQTTEFLSFWEAQLRVCSQTSKTKPINELVSNFQNNVWSKTGAAAVSAYFNWAPKIATAFPVQNLLFSDLVKGAGFSGLAGWTPANPKIYFIEAFAYLVNLKSFCPCNSIINLLTDGRAPDSTSFPSLILPADKIHSFENQVGLFCQTTYPSGGCTPRSATTLEFETEEELEEL